ncbi:MAG: PadR family transcriptional regulator, partial [Clostridiales bacterium]|nr:PadR family transcriptional regulator [Clostridiales bacterium]
MENTIQSDLIRGHIDTIILKALFDGDRYGYDIVREIEQKSSGQYKLKQPTLYSCLKRLEVKGLVRAYWGAKSNGGRRKYFTLTEMGRELFIQNQSDWEYSRTIIDKLISDREYDFKAAEGAAAANSEKDEAHNNRINEPLEDELETEEPQDEYETEETEELVEEEIEQEEETFGEPEEEQPEEEILPPAQPEPTREVVFSDTTAIMNELFRRQTESATVSYSEKIVNEKYIDEKPKDAFS